MDAEARVLQYEATGYSADLCLLLIDVESAVSLGAYCLDEISACTTISEVIVSPYIYVWKGDRIHVVPSGWMRVDVVLLMTGEVSAERRHSALSRNSLAQSLTEPHRASQGGACLREEMNRNTLLLSLQVPRNKISWS